MSRVKGGKTANQRRKNLLAYTKGYRLQRSSKERAAREAMYHAQLHAFDHRKDKKNDFRRLWITRINAALRPFGIKYSRFVKQLADENVQLDRKSLAAIALKRPDTFERVVKKVSK